MDMQVLNLTMSAFETASSFYDAAGDEVGVVKSDMWRAQAAIDVFLGEFCFRGMLMGLEGRSLLMKLVDWLVA